MKSVFCCKNLVSTTRDYGMQTCTLLPGFCVYDSPMDCPTTIIITINTARSTRIQQMATATMVATRLVRSRLKTATITTSHEQLNNSERSASVTERPPREAGPPTLRMSNINPYLTTYKGMKYWSGQPPSQIVVKLLFSAALNRNNGAQTDYLNVYEQVTCFGGGGRGGIVPV